MSDKMNGGGCAKAKQWARFGIKQERERQNNRLKSTNEKRTRPVCDPHNTCLTEPSIASRYTTRRLEGGVQFDSFSETFQVVFYFS